MPKEFSRVPIRKHKRILIKKRIAIRSGIFFSPSSDHKNAPSPIDHGMIAVLSSSLNLGLWYWADIIKHHQQIMGKSFHHVTAYLRSQGIRNMYRGFSSCLIMLGVSRALGFGLTPLYRNYLPFEWKETSKDLIASGLAACSKTIFVTPLERAKILIQYEGGRRIDFPRSPFRVIPLLYQNGGLNSLYRGFSNTLQRSVIGFSTWITVRNELERRLPESKNGYEKQKKSFVTGGLAGVASQTLIFPLDVIKAMRQGMLHFNSSQGTLNIAKRLIAENGLARVYRGYPLQVAFAFGSSATFNFILKTIEEKLRFSSFRKG